MKRDHDYLDGFDIGTTGPTLGDSWEAIKAEVDARRQRERRMRTAYEAALLVLIAGLYLVSTYLEQTPWL